jgi:hypothetical protein
MNKKDKEKVHTGTVPPQKEGGKSDYVETEKFDSAEAAKQKFREVHEKLSDINNWQQFSDFLSASFILVDAKGRQIKDKKPEPGNFIKIGIPPGPAAGDGYDWVKIESIDLGKDDKQDYDFFSIRVRPAQNPEKDSADIAHFYTDKSTNTFTLERTGSEIKVGVHGRNEIPNLEKSAGMDKVRNQSIAIGALFGLSYLQWQNFIRGLLK